MKIVIAGAGLAGMQAAWRLANEGHEVTVLESSNRVGGRSWSQQLSNGEYIERGGEFISPEDHAIRYLCAELNIQIVSHEIAFNRRWMHDGTRMSAEQLNGYTNKLHNTIRAMERDRQNDISLDAAAREAFGSDYQSNRMYLRMITSLSQDATKVSARGVLHREGNATDYVEHGGRVLKGNNFITQEIHRRLGSESVKFGQVITAVEQKNDKVVFTTSSGDEFVGDAAVIAIPLPKLKELMKGFSLPSLVREVIETRQMGVAAKISVGTRSGAMPRGEQYPEELWWTWNSASPYGGHEGRPAVTAFAGTKPTVDKLELQDGGVAWKKKIQDSRKDLDLTDEYIMTDWQHQPHTLGVYSAPGLEWRPEFETAFDDLVGRVAFAGEHTYVSTMNGAVYSGTRAAKIIQKHFG
ncbi:FAD-dependent oxidoreductase (plasmid) [Brucella anthropi]|uniref:flavin monoamine oxidase family protein n=1 Tax=Brucella anthropi TaxID=529 RepID=UPI00188A7547|nr:NAD(P)/FAD-dependent oxidoreductase [Brucella anthropi]QPA29855.1 FAD-dependent oxidoreductase [Brucella anthropi]